MEAAARSCCSSRLDSNSRSRGLASAGAVSSPATSPLPRHRRQIWNLRIDCIRSTVHDTAAVRKNPNRLQYSARNTDSELLVSVQADYSDLWRLDKVVDLIKDGAVRIRLVAPLHALVT